MGPGLLHIVAYTAIKIDELTSRKEQNHFKCTNLRLWSVDQIVFNCLLFIPPEMNCNQAFVRSSPWK